MQKSAFFSILAARKGIRKVFEMVGSQFIVFKVIIAVGKVVIHLFGPALSTVNADEFLKKR